jgi:hypothetical protein
MLLVVGATWVVLGAVRNPGGADSPEEVVDGLVAALNSEDFITLAELLDPAERRSFVTPMIDDVVPELIRVGVLGDDFDLGSVDGLDLEIENIQYEIVPTAHPDLFQARFTGGTASATVTPDELPLDEALSDEISADTSTETSTEPSTETAEIRSDPNGPVLAIVERDNRWYLSMWHTLGESIRMASGVELPALADLPVAVGADSPEAAMEQMLQHIADLDVTGLIGMVDPGEADALYRYIGLALDDFERARSDIMAQLDNEQISWRLSDLEFDVDRDGDTAAVTLTAGRLDVIYPQGAAAVTFTGDEALINVDFDDGATRLDLDARLQPPNYSLTVSFDDEFDSVSSDIEMVADADDNRINVTGNINGDPLEAGLAVDPAGECSEGFLRFADVDESGCFEDGFSDTGLPAGLGLGSADLERTIDQLATPAGLQLPLGTTHRVDGKWYFAPVSTAMDWLTQSLRNVEDDAISDLVDAFSELQSSLDDTGFDLGDEVLPEEQGPSNVAPVFVEVAAGERAEVEVQFAGPGWSVVNLQAPPGTAMTLVVLETAGIDPTVEVDDALLTANDDFDDLTLSSGVSFTMPDAGTVEIRVAEYFSNPGSTQMLISAGTAEAGPIALEELLGR